MAHLAEWQCSRPESLQALGEALGRLAPAGVCVGLLGDLGAGKTTFTQGVGIGLGVAAEITSPTFALMVEYEAACPLVHVDAYRLRPGEAEGIGLEETLEDWSGLAIVEWADLVAEALPAACVFVQITIVPTGRLVKAWATTDRMISVLERWEERA
ncbi:MAG: tRNA (adenosine(37)-N6)-threonylcarbamoyltransferase complex ATPase subunit type 1 TsaE [Deltaproteobacteria bacterium]|nr:tRNA (adenosine(37)-N6)-threonylcarbamoyltransferase complex ATPase subunit type 1 TsaE [Deltaproteobacteria bacterium]HCH65660.1 tRNA (adenosine(37)-N6)-threonylcarbamoyltransferase complex ATPase subunit type 1 TsaE [Deltaproteobacteria bacterium]